MNCKSLENVSMSRNVDVIRNDTFYDCDNLTAFVIPEGVHTIEGGAFWSCNKLLEVMILPTVKDIDDTAFSLTHTMYVWGYEGTAAETYALDNSNYFGFVSVGSAEDFVSLPAVGDVDADEVLTIKDATYIQKILAQLVIPSDLEIYSAEFDGDLYVTIKAATYIQKTLAGIV